MGYLGILCKYMIYLPSGIPNALQRRSNTLCYDIWIYSDQNLLFVGQWTGYTRSQLKALCTYRNIIKKCLVVSLGQNIILGTIKLKSWINMLPRIHKYSGDPFIL